MKIFKIILITFVVLVLIGVIGVFAFLKTFDINRFKPQIISSASAALGRAVDFKDIDLELSLRKGIHLTLKQLTIRDDAGFQSGDFLTVENISLGVGIMPLLIKRQILVSSIHIHSPQCIVIRQKDGQINVQNLGKPVSLKKDYVVSPETRDSQVQKAIPVSRAALSVPFISAETIAVKNGKVTYIDRSFEPELVLDISQVRLKIEHFSLAEPFTFTLQAAYLSDRPNILVKGNATVNMETQSIKLKNATVATDLSSLSLSRLQSSLAMLKEIELPEQVKGKFNASIERMEVGAKGLVSLISSGKLTGGSIRHKQLTLPVEPISSEFQITESKIRIGELSLGLGKGRLTAQGKLDDYTGAQNFNFDVNIQDLDLSQLLNQKGQPVKLKGFLVGKFKAEGRGFSPGSLRDSLFGEGALEIKKGRLTDINVLKIVLSKISMIPNLVAKIEANLPERYKEKLTQKDTILTKVKTDLVVGNGLALLKQVEIEADGFLFSGEGEVDFNQRFSLDGSFFIPEDLAASMVENVPELEFLLDEKGEIRIPLQVSGKIPDIKFAVDLEYIGKKLIKKKASEELDKVLDKLFEEKEKPAEQKLIEDILDTIFK